MSQFLPLRTVAREAILPGIGLHSGAMVTARLQPRVEAGIVFARTDLLGQPEIAASLENVATTTHATTLSTGSATVSTTEHLLAALWALGVTNCRVALDGPEVPILDGSAAPWCRLIEEAGILDAAGARPAYGLSHPVWIASGQGSVLGLPHPEFRLTVAVDFGVDYAGRQTIDFVVNPRTFADELAPARTFTLEAWIEPLRAQGLIRGGSVENAIVLGAKAPSLPFRFPDELARHKALDVVGDLALLFGRDGGILNAHLIAVCAGHGLHRSWMQECVERNALIRL